MSEPTLKNRPKPEDTDNAYDYANENEKWFERFEQQETERLEHAEDENERHKQDSEMMIYREWLKGYIQAKKETWG